MTLASFPRFSSETLANFAVQASEISGANVWVSFSFILCPRLLSGSCLQETDLTSNCALEKPGQLTIRIVQSLDMQQGLKRYGLYMAAEAACKHVAVLTALVVASGTAVKEFKRLITEFAMSMSWQEEFRFSTFSKGQGLPTEEPSLCGTPSGCVSCSLMWEPNLCSGVANALATTLMRVWWACLA